MSAGIQPHWNRTHTKYAILVSDSCVGWSGSNVPELAYDSRVVGYVLEHLKIDGWRESFDYFASHADSMVDFHNRPAQREFDEFLQSLGYKNMYLPPIAGIRVVWVKAGRRWRIVAGAECEDILEFEDTPEVEWVSFK